MEKIRLGIVNAERWGNIYSLDFSDLSAQLREQGYVISKSEIPNEKVIAECFGKIKELLKTVGS